VFKLLKLLLGLGCLGVFVWWGLTVPLGDRTLYGHLRAIGQTKESQELVRGTKQKVSEVKRRIVTGTEAGKAPKPAEGPPQEQLTDGDREQMRKIIAGARANRQ
jgi:hypothetical protein